MVGLVFVFRGIRIGRRGIGGRIGGKVGWISGGGFCGAAGFFKSLFEQKFYL
jgi:hypothetical protein